MRDRLTSSANASFITLPNWHRIWTRATEMGRRKPLGFHPGAQAGLLGFSPKSSRLRCTRFSGTIGA
jgi:hypothetical protein